jgi:hypothetical protein
MVLQPGHPVSGWCPQRAIPYGHRLMNLWEFRRSSVEQFDHNSACSGPALRRDAPVPTALARTIVAETVVSPSLVYLHYPTREFRPLKAEVAAKAPARTAQDPARNECGSYSRR